MSLPWETNNDNNQHSENEYTPEADNLDNIFGESSGENQGEEGTQEESPENIFEDSSSDGVEDHSDELAEEPHDDAPAEDPLEDIEDEMLAAPRGKKGVGTPQFSERDVYQIVNLVTVFEAMSDNQKSWVDNLFSFSASGNNDIKRAIRIVAMDNKEIDSKTLPVEVLGTVYRVTTSNDTSRAIEAILDSISAVESLSVDDRGTLVSLTRKIAKKHPDANGKSVPVRITRNSPSTEIVSAMRDIMERCVGIGDSIDMVSSSVEALSAAREQ